MTKPIPPEVREYFSYDGESGDLRRIKAAATGSRAHDLNRPIGWIGSEGYRLVRFNGAQYPAHRVAWFLRTGKDPQETIDHINGVRSDNRWTNLREATVAENNRNRPAWGANGKGVRANKGRGKPYVAAISVDGSTIHLGTFDTIDGARAAYAEAFATALRAFTRVVHRTGTRGGE